MRSRWKDIKKSKKTVKVRDHLPLPRTDDVVLKTIKLNPASTNKRDERNLLTWKLPIGPGEKKKSGLSSHWNIQGIFDQWGFRNFHLLPDANRR